jgi:nicotinamidase-related amidase
MNPAPAALIVIDVQDGLDDPQYGARNNPDAEQRIAELLAVWRENNLPVIFGQYLSSRADSPLRPGSPGTAIKRTVAPLPGEGVMEKRGNSMFKGTGLDEHLRKLGVKKLILVGLATDACISASARESKDLGYATTVVEDACATFDRRGLKGERLPATQVHEMELSILQAGGVAVCSTTEVVRRARLA